MTDIVIALREAQAEFEANQGMGNPCDQMFYGLAADEIEALRARVESAENNRTPTAPRSTWEAEAKALRAALTQLIEAFDEHVAIPDANCACHISPPCGDCEEWGFSRVAMDDARAALNTEGEG